MYRILSLDGGGIRGLVTAILLQRLDKAVPGWRDSIDLVAGTSTGGILALGLARGMTPTQLRALYEQRGRRIFDDSWLDDLRDLGKIMGAEYDNDNLAAELKKAFGKSRLRDLGRPHLVTEAVPQLPRQRQRRQHAGLEGRAVHLGGADVFPERGRLH